jgi:hypothetical protein
MAMKKNVWLPYVNFLEVIEVLENRHTWKQITYNLL